MLYTSVDAIREDYENRLFDYSVSVLAWGSNAYKRYQNTLKHYRDFCNKNGLTPIY